jgi:hypothetical protein
VNLQACGFWAAAVLGFVVNPVHDPFPFTTFSYIGIKWVYDHASRIGWPFDWPYYNHFYLRSFCDQA